MNWIQLIQTNSELNFNASVFHLRAIASPCAQVNLIACNSIIIARK